MAELDNAASASVSIVDMSNEYGLDISTNRFADFVETAIGTIRMGSNRSGHRWQYIPYRRASLLTPPALIPRRWVPSSPGLSWHSCSHDDGVAAHG